MQYKGCTLEYWGKCQTQTGAIAFCRSRGSELFSYMDGVDLATFDTMVNRQNSSVRLASVACSGLSGYYPDLNAILWTGLRSRSGSSTCGASCVWQVRVWRGRGAGTCHICTMLQVAGAGSQQLHVLQCTASSLLRPGSSQVRPRALPLQDIRTGNLVTDVASIKPCAMNSDGDAIEFIKWGSVGCPNGGSNDAPVTYGAHFICAANCGGWQRAAVLQCQWTHARHP
jgi:hypothetical protein